MSETVEVQLTRCGYCHQRAWFADRSSLFRTIRFPAMVAIIRHPGIGTILFDTGYGYAIHAGHSPEAKLYSRLLPFELPAGERMAARLAQLRVSQVDLIFLSHLHPDHIGGLREVPGTAPILHSRDGLAKLRSLRGMPKLRSAFFPHLLPKDFPSRAKAIEDLPQVPLDAPFTVGHDLAGDGSLVAVELPGHAAGQYGLFCRLSSDRRILLCADAAWLSTTIERRIRPTWAARLIADDADALDATQGRLHQFALAHPEVQIIPSHCEESIAAYGQKT